MSLSVRPQDHVDVSQIAQLDAEVLEHLAQDLACHVAEAMRPAFLPS